MHRDPLRAEQAALDPCLAESGLLSVSVLLDWCMWESDRTSCAKIDEVETGRDEQGVA